MISKFPRQALPLLLLYLDGCKEIIGRTRFSKILFIIENEVPEIKEFFDETYEWFPYHYGPFSDGLISDLVWLDYWGFIETDEKDTDIDDETVVSICRITDKGKKIVEEKILPQLPKELVKRIEEIKIKFNRMSLFDLLKYVYKKYPKYTIRSKIREEVISSTQ